MELYEIIAAWAGWPAVVAVMLLAGGYFLVVNNRHVGILKEKNGLLSEELQLLRDHGPDMLAERLAERLRIANQELERVSKDRESSAATISSKEKEIQDITKRIARHKLALVRATEMLDVVTEYGLMCPKCKAPLLTRAPDYELVADHSGREIDVEREVMVYECGMMKIDDHVVRECPREEW